MHRVLDSGIWGRSDRLHLGRRHADYQAERVLLIELLSDFVKELRRRHCFGQHDLVRIALDQHLPTLGHGKLHTFHGIQLPGIWPV